MPIVESTINRIRRSGDNPALDDTGGQYGWPWWVQRFPSGVVVDDSKAVGLTAFYRGVSMIAGTIAALPIDVYTRDEDGVARSAESPENYWLWGRPNNEMIRQAMWERVVADLVRGNAFIFVDKKDDGSPAALWWIYRRRVKVGRTSSRVKVYQIDDEIPMIDYKAGGEIIHIPNWGDSILGYDIVEIAAQAIALGLSAEAYAAQFFTQGQVPPGIITSDQELTIAQSDALAERWARTHSGLANQHRIAVLSHGAKFQQTSLDPEKSQLEAMRRYQAGEIATLLGLPPHLLSMVDKTTSWGSGIEEMNRATITLTLQSHIRRVEQSIDDDLLMRELTGKYVKFDLGGLLRGTTLQRYTAYGIGYGRWLSTNDIRQDEDLPPVEGGDNVLAALNMVPLEQLVGPGSTTAAPIPG